MVATTMLVVTTSYMLREDIFYHIVHADMGLS